MYWQKRLNKPNKDIEIEKKILKIRKDNPNYGYRRITAMLKRSGLIINKKKVQRLVQKLKLQVKSYSRKSRKYSSYKGQVGKVAPNVVNRNFKASRPNQLWLTDVTEFRIKGREERLYLSPILDVYNSEIISYTLSHHPTIKLTNSMLDKAIKGISTCLLYTSDAADEAGMV